MVILFLLKNFQTWGERNFKKVFTTKNSSLLTALNTSVCWLSILWLDGILQVRENLAKNEKIEKFEKKFKEQKIYKFQVFIDRTEHIHIYAWFISIACHYFSKF